MEIDEADQRTMAAASEALTLAWAHPTTLYLQDPIRTGWGRHRVLLCHVDGPPDAPDTVVVKEAVAGDGAIFNEWSVLSWLGSIPDVAGLVPTLHAGSVDHQLIVVEDLGGGPNLHRMLQTSRSAAIDALCDSQAVTAAIHTATRGRGADLEAVRRTLPDGPPPRTIGGAPDAIDALDHWMPLEADGRREVAAAVDRMAASPEFATLTFTDQCPVNRILTATGIRAIDLEMATFAHPMLDGAYAAIGHLACTARRLRASDGTALPDAVRATATQGYRRAVTAGYPEYRDDLGFSEDLTAAAVVWLARILGREAPRVRRDTAPGFFSVTPRQRVIATLGAFDAVPDVRERMPRLATWARSLERDLRTAWQETPAFDPPSAFA